MFESCLRNKEKPVFLDWLFSCRQCSHMRPTVAVTSRLYIATAFSDVAMTLDEERVLPPQLQKPEIISGFFHFAAYDSLYAPSCSYFASLCRHRFQQLYADSQYDLLKLRESSSVHLCEQELRPQADGQPSTLASLTGLTYIKQTDLGQQNA